MHAVRRMPSGIQSRKVPVHRLWVRVVYHFPEDLPELVEATSSVNTAPIPEDFLHNRVAFEAQLCNFTGMQRSSSWNC